MVPAEAFPCDWKVCVYEVVPSLNWVSVVAAATRGESEENKNNKTRPKPARMVSPMWPYSVNHFKHAPNGHRPYGAELPIGYSFRTTIDEHQRFVTVRGVGMAGRASKKEGFLKNWWKSKQDAHLRILSTVFLSCIAIIISCIIQLAILRGSPAWDDYTTASWVLLLIAGLVAIWIGPEFIHYVGQFNLLNDVLATTARSEVSRRRSEAQEAARLLGTKHMERLDEHLVEVGLKRAKKKS